MVTWKSSPKPKRLQLGLVRLVHLALNSRQRGHARLKLLPGDDTRRLVQLLFDPGERELRHTGRRRRAAAPALVLILGLGPVPVLGFGFAG